MCYSARPIRRRLYSHRSRYTSVPIRSGSTASVTDRGHLYFERRKSLLIIIFFLPSVFPRAFMIEMQSNFRTSIPVAGG
jgi:hypothetical protein